MYDDFRRRLSFLSIEPAGDALRLSLRGVGRLDPLHLVGVASLAHHAQRKGSWLDLHDIDPDAAGYATRMNLGDVIAMHSGRHCLPALGRTVDQGHRLLEISRIERASDARRWAELVRDRAAAADIEIIDALHEGLAEIGENVALHSQTYGFAAAQTFRKGGVIRFAVADAGVGLQTTLADEGATSDHHALTMALAGRSSLAGAHGFGVQTTWDLISRLGGTMVLGTNSAAVARRSDGKESRSPLNVPGTIFEGTIPANQRNSEPTYSPPPKDPWRDNPPRRRRFKPR